MPKDSLYGNNNSVYYGSLDESSTRDGVQPYWGNGNTVQNYNVFVNHAKNVELGLKVHQRQGPDIAPSPDGSYDVPAGNQAPNRAAWNFDFSVNTGVEGGHKTLNDFDFRITVTSGDGEVGVFNLQHLASGNTPWLNSAGAGFADEDGSDPQISQNSVNLGFAFMQAIFGADYNDAGEHYTIRLEAYEGHKLIGAVEQSIDVVAPV